MPTSAASQPLFLYSTTVSDVGTVRSNNQDSSFAGEHLIAVCDGMGGHAGGDTASTIAIRSLAHIEQDDTGGDVETVTRMVEASVLAAHDAIVGKAKRERKLAGMGTTVTAVALVAGYWVVAHIGDSRAYLLRDGRLQRLTCDHSYVQHLIDTGRITPGEAKNHPQRNVVMRVLGDFDIDPRPDIAIRKAHPADRWLLCSDGLCGVLEDSTIEEAMATITDQGECAQRLVSMALKAGSTDNVTAVIADATLALDADAFDLPHQTPLVGGAASRSLEPIADIVNEPVASAPALRDGNSPAQRAAALMQTRSGEDEAAAATTRVVQPSTVREESGERDNPDTGEIPVVQTPDGRITADPNDPEVAKAIRHEQSLQKQASHTKRVRRRLIAAGIALLTVIALAAAGGLAYWWSQTRYYVGNADGKVAIYQGVPTDVFGFELSHEVERTSIDTEDLPQTWISQLEQGIVVGSLTEAENHVEIIRDEMTKLQQENDDAAATGEMGAAPDATAKQDDGSDSGSNDSDSSSNAGSNSSDSGTSSQGDDA
ncbi:BofC C-terminal domain-containing protein [Bifidobacterium eulemuris]|uniref:Protein phosphatase 2C domain-containing protein n=1 Tax=Bifidobacterium eulemuris TaxID=1765219 RepID=A0A261GDY3_9BIFI|nr:protein phosphatase 2C domain-containing protein [Bifidobacterium eulemuris]OZG69652.1 serine/threonine protein phosphatase [Bifidobacterium eulemuris]QOL32235.1 protein phosphatase 2C domain-containing protein [Bifidobacterium eulemuris]